ncbi:MAG: spore maturation protein A, partial [Oscillospiraceae bacterium]|nr:spore maturation protein A [Oscillospiraceae bacterium]
MKWIFGGLVIISVLLGAATGNVGAVSNAAIESGGAAISLCITLAGVICLWSGVMHCAEKAGLIGIIAKIAAPVLGLLFRGIDKKGKAFGYIVLNLTANALGLGNASTPFGIAAVNELAKEEHADGTATDNIILFVVMNTASLQIFPA